MTFAGEFLRKLKKISWRSKFENTFDVKSRDSSGDKNRKICHPQDTHFWRTHASVWICLVIYLRPTSAC